jgi:ribosomal-protein-serine acetyltransferase
MKLLIDNALAIEPVKKKHLPELMELVNVNRLFLREWLTWLDYIKTPEEFALFVEGAEKRTEEGLEFSGVIVQNDRIVGRMGLYHIDKMNRIASIGYWVGEDTQGKGVITKACDAILKHGFETLNLNRIEIKCGTGNSRSLAIPKRLGFQREGIIRQGEYLNGRFIDLYLYSMLKDEWLEIQSKTKDD